MEKEKFIKRLQEVDENIEKIPNKFCDPQHWVNRILEGADNLTKQDEKNN
jgi:hypothetical protein